MKLRILIIMVGLCSACGIEGRTDRNGLEDPNQLKASSGAWSEDWAFVREMERDGKYYRVTGLRLYPYAHLIFGVKCGNDPFMAMRGRCSPPYEEEWEKLIASGNYNGEMVFWDGPPSNSEFECEVSIEQERVCGDGYYVQSLDEAGTTVVTTLDCTGVEDAYETVFTGVGYLRIDEIDTGTESGSFAGLPLFTGLSATISVQDGDLSLTGSFEVGATQ